MPRQFGTDHTKRWSVLLPVQLFGEHCVRLRRREDLVEQLEAASQVSAGKLARAGLHVDVAADAVQIQRERVDERLTAVSTEQLGVAPRVGLPLEQRLLQ